MDKIELSLNRTGQINLYFRNYSSCVVNLSLQERASVYYQIFVIVVFFFCGISFAQLRFGSHLKILHSHWRNKRLESMITCYTSCKDSALVFPLNYFHPPKESHAVAQVVWHMTHNLI